MSRHERLLLKVSVEDKEKAEKWKTTITYAAESGNGSARTVRIKISGRLTVSDGGGWTFRGFSRCTNHAPDYGSKRDEGDAADVA